MLLTRLIVHHPATFRLRPGYCCPVCDLVMPDLLARLRLYATFVTSPSVIFPPPLVTRKTPRLPALLFYPCGWESRQCMQQQQRRGAQGFSCEVLPQFCVLRPNPPTRPCRHPTSTSSSNIVPTASTLSMHAPVFLL